MRDLKQAREKWRWRGRDRPAFAVVPEPGQESVWDYPRPPLLALDSREVVVRWGEILVARTTQAIRVLETSHPPSFYLPWRDVIARDLFKEAPGSSFCEWKGPARYWSLEAAGRRLPSAAWSYPEPLAGSEAVAECVAFYASLLDCYVDNQPVVPQPGGFYGGWITPELVGPFKGTPGSSDW